MSSYSVQATKYATRTPKLERGQVKIITQVPIYWVISENPEVVPGQCAVLMGGQSLTVNVPVRCCSLAVMALGDPGMVTVIEQHGGARASCSA